MMTRFKLAISSSFLAGVLLQSVAAHAATYYVSTTGNDSNSCAQAQTQSRPKQTIPAGVKCLAGGDTLIVKAGTYVNQEILNPTPGTANAYTVIAGDPAGARPVLQPNAATLQRGLYCTGGEACRYIEWRHFEVSGGYEYMKLHGTETIGYPHHMKIIDNVFHDSQQSGMVIASSVSGFIGGDHLFRGNEFYRTGSGTPNYRPGFNNIYNPGNRSIVENNVFRNGANGVGIWKSANGFSDTAYDIQNVIVRNNIFYDWARPSIDPWLAGATGYNGIHVSVPGGGHQIYNNVMYRSCEVSTCKFIRVRTPDTGRNTPTTPILIYNNTLYNWLNSQALSIRMESTTGGPHVIANNISYQAGAGISAGGHTVLRNLTTDPSFADATGGNFSLQKGSAAIDAGETLREVTIDFRGVRRPQGAGYDIGAYEAGDGSDPLPPKGLSVK
jgi:hypothetical protein